jgi:hypothetical protein
MYFQSGNYPDCYRSIPNMFKQYQYVHPINSTMKIDEVLYPMCSLINIYTGWLLAIRALITLKRVVYII